jgi:hypothetical protein
MTAADLVDTFNTACGFVIAIVSLFVMWARVDREWERRGVEIWAWQR